MQVARLHRRIRNHWTLGMIKHRFIWHLRNGRVSLPLLWGQADARPQIHDTRWASSPVGCCDAVKEGECHQQKLNNKAHGFKIGIGGLIIYKLLKQIHLSCGLQFQHHLVSRSH